MDARQVGKEDAEAGAAFLPEAVGFWAQHQYTEGFLSVQPNSEYALAFQRHWLSSNGQYVGNSVPSFPGEREEVEKYNALPVWERA